MGRWELCFLLVVSTSHVRKEERKTEAGQVGEGGLGPVSWAGGLGGLPGRLGFFLPFLIPFSIFCKKKTIDRKEREKEVGAKKSDKF